MNERFPHGGFRAWLAGEIDDANGKYLADLSRRLHHVLPDQSARELVVDDMKAWPAVDREAALERARAIDKE